MSLVLTSQHNVKYTTAEYSDQETSAQTAAIPRRLLHLQVSEVTIGTFAPTIRGLTKP